MTISAGLTGSDFVVAVVVVCAVVVVTTNDSAVEDACGVSVCSGGSFVNTGTGSSLSVGMSLCGGSADSLTGGSEISVTIGSLSEAEVFGVVLRSVDEAVLLSALD